MELEDSSIKKIDDILEIIELLEKKGEAHRDTVISNIEILEQEIDFAAKNLESGVQMSPEKLLDKISENLLKKKPLANINMANKKIYKYVSKLGKRIDKLKSYPDRNINFHNIDFDHKALKEAIAEYIVHYSVDHGQEDALKKLDNMCEEMGLVDPELIQEKITKTQDIQKINKIIKDKNIDEFMKWMTFNEDKLIQIKSKIPINAYELSIVKEIGNSRDISKIRDLCKILYNKFSQNRAQIKQFMTALIFINWNQNPIDTDITPPNSLAIDSENKLAILETLTERYKSYLDIEVKWKTIEDSFLDDVCSINGISKKNPLLEVFKAGVCNYSKFINLQGLNVDEDLNDMEIDVDIGKEFTYHNIIVCPVSKEICSNDNPPVLLTCGHVISDASAKKLANFGNNTINKRFKCPVCPTEQIYGKLRVLKIDK